MAINKIVAPLATAPNVFAAPVINHLNAHAINVNPIIKIANGYVKKGAMFCIGGELFAADADTAISGTALDAHFVKLTVSGTVATPSYVASSTGIAWNGAYHGWYDNSSNYCEPLWHKNTGTKTTPIPGMFSHSSGELGSYNYNVSFFCTVYGSAKFVLEPEYYNELTIIITKITNGVSSVLYNAVGTLPTESFILEAGSIYDVSINVDGIGRLHRVRGCGFTGEIAVGL